MRRWLLLGLLAMMPTATVAQSAGEVERCFQTPGACSSGGGGAPVPAPAPAAAPVAVTAAPRGPDYNTVLQSSEADRRKIQESLRTLDKYNGPIDGNLQSEATMKGIGDWQRSHQLSAIGKLTPGEAVALNNEAARAPIRRLDPSTQVASASPPGASPSNADVLKSLQARRAERRKAAEPKAEPVCDGTFTNDGPRSGRFSLNCFSGKFAGSGTYESQTGSPNDHIIARGQTGRGQPVVIVIGLPAQLAMNMYGGL